MEDHVKVLVTGASGLLGRAIMKELLKRNFSTIGLAFSRVGEGLRKCDLRVDGQVEALVDEIKPHVIIHAAAERFPDKVENNFEETKMLNVNASGRLALIAEKAGIKFIYISSTYVFDGKNPPYGPNDTPNPINKYGETKLLGENAVLQYNQNACILRISVLYGEIEYLEETSVTTLLNDIVKKIPKSISHTHRRYPTHTKDIASILGDLIQLMRKGKDIKGIYQWCGYEVFTKYDMAVQIAQSLDLSYDHLTPDFTESLGTNRPKDCLMCTEKVKNLGINYDTKFQPAIKEILQKFI